MRQKPKKARRNARGKSGAASLIVLLALLAVTVGLFVWQNQSANRGAPEATLSPTVEPSPTVELQIDPNAGELVTPTPAPTEPGVAIPGWGSITLPAGVTEAATTLKNPEANEGWYYLTFEMRLPTVDEETGEESYEVLFTTGLIPPGQYCNQVTLTRALEPGEYNVILHVQPYRMSDKTPTNNADTETVLIVEQKRKDGKA